MAFPVIESVAAWDGPYDSTHTPDLPSGIQAGDLLLCLLSVDQLATLTPSVGWTELAQESYSNQISAGVFYRYATGDSADAITVTLSESKNTSALIYRISGAAPESAVSGSANSGYSSTLYAPAHSLPSGEAEDALWLYLHAGDYTQYTTTAPSGYASLTNSGVSPYACGAYKTLTAASEPSRTASASRYDEYVTFAVAVTAIPPRDAHILLDGPLGAPALIGSPWAAMMTADGPLGTPAILGGSDPVALFTTPGPLATPALTGQWVNACTVRLPGPLGRPKARAVIPPVAVIKTLGPLGSPQFRARHRQTIQGYFGPIPGPLAAPFILAQQRLVAAVPELPPGAMADTRQRLLSDQFPLRRSIVLPDYREDTWLPWVYGYATVNPIPLDAEGLEYLLADHAIVRIVSVRSGGSELDGWQLVQRADETGHPVATITFAQPPDSFAATIAGKRHPQSGALLEHPADIAEDMLAEAGWSVPSGAFDALRAAWPTLTLGGILDSPLTLRDAISCVMSTVDADWSASPLSAWAWDDASQPSKATLTAANCPDGTATARHDSVINTLRISYGYDWAEGAPGGSLVLVAPDVLNDQGELTADLDLPWVRRARDALALGEAALQRRARAEWTYSLPIAPEPELRPGDRITIDQPWLPSGQAIITAADIRETGQTLTAVRWAGVVPRVELSAQGAYLPEASVQPVSVSYVDGIATITILTDLGEPLAGASVTLDETQTRTTDRNGQVQFATERGWHDLLVVAEGYATLEMEIDI